MQKYLYGITATMYTSRSSFALGRLMTAQMIRAAADGQSSEIVKNSVL